MWVKWINGDLGDEIPKVIVPPIMINPRFIPTFETPGYPCLSRIDSYGDTIFNYLQLDIFLSEWEAIPRETLAEDDLIALKSVRDLALLCRVQQRGFLLFKGD